MIHETFPTITLYMPFYCKQCKKQLYIQIANANGSRKRSYPFNCNGCGYKNEIEVEWPHIPVSIK